MEEACLQTPVRWEEGKGGSYNCMILCLLYPLKSVIFCVILNLFYLMHGHVTR